jgi:beta-glucanase (GH16 family)
VANRRLLVFTLPIFVAIAVLAVVVRGGTTTAHPAHPATSSPTSRRNAKSAHTVTSPISPGAQYTKLVFSDDFTGPVGTPPSPSKWIHDVGAYGSPDNELQTYTDSPANASVDGHGDLAIVARQQTATGPDELTRNYTSARLETQGLFSTTYGLIEARMKIPAGTGLWSAFWMLGDDIDKVGYPASGEVDVMETLGQSPFKVRGTLHGPGLPSGYARGQDFDSPSSLAAGFHTYAVSWSANSITWLLDGTPYASVTSASLAPGQTWVFDRPFHLLLDLAVGGDWPGPPDASTPFPATLLVNWVRVYQ